MSLEMAQQFVADGVDVVVCTPHIFPGVFPNTGPDIVNAVENLQSELDQAGIPLTLLAGADVHMAPDVVNGLKNGRILPINGGNYVLIEPPHHVPPPRIEEFFFGLTSAGYTPILTHPERLQWMSGRYEILQRLIDMGTWMQVTAGSLAGKFGTLAKDLAIRMLKEGKVHVLASDAHDTVSRPPSLGNSWQIAAQLVGEEEANLLVLERPLAIVTNRPAVSIASPIGK